MDTRIELYVRAENALEENKLADALESMVSNISEDATVTRVKADASTLDLGGILIVLIGSQFAIELAKGLSAWMIKHPGGTLKVTVEKEGETEKKTIEANGLKADQLAEALSIEMKK